MSKVIGGILVAVAAFAAAQFPGERPPGGPRDQAGEPTLAKRMFKFDADKNGVLVKSEITDDRLKGLFDRADGDKNGKLTKAELDAYEAKEDEGGDDFERGPGGPPPGGFGPGGPGGFGGRGGPGGPGFGRPGEILPPPLREALELTAEQERLFDALQKDVDAKIAKILTAEQKKTLDSMRRRGPGGPPGGPGGFRRGPGGPPPGEDEGPGGPPPRGPRGGGRPGGPPPDEPEDF